MSSSITACRLPRWALVLPTSPTSTLSLSSFPNPLKQDGWLKGLYHKSSGTPKSKAFSAKFSAPKALRITNLLFTLCFSICSSTPKPSIWEVLGQG